MKVSVLIPVFDEASTARELFDRVLSADTSGLTKDIVVVESGSTDGTKEIVEEYEKKGLIRAFYQERPRGKGNALKVALENAEGDIILIQDADLEYDVKDYPQLLKPIVEGRADFVLGSRHLGAKDWQFRRFLDSIYYATVINLGGRIFTGLFNLLYGTSLTDPATMFKVFRRSAAEGLVWRSDYFDLDWEIVAKLVRSGSVPVEVPVSYASRSVAEGKKIRFWRDGTLVLLAILRFRVGD